MATDDLIEVYHDAVPAEACAAMLRRFEASGQDQPGLVGGGLFPELKHSRDISISGQDAWRDVEASLTQAVLAGLSKYVRRYPYTLIAPLMLEHGAPGQRRRLDADGVVALDDAALDGIIKTIFRPGRINLQRYRAGEGGYPYWHCELYPRDPGCDTLHRHLLWTIYLNDGFEAGETEFFHQRRKVAPRTGSLLIAPAAFTHTHRGNRPQGGDKYIATSWVLFNRAEQIFGKPAA
ncbi:MAG: 2OG-Fe(II) oxygenase [Arenimonas sp. SCN 70-307]|uniref:2OG-Fe(II) oxygenase n=1 Tax=Arenimonas sp. SCN 70-307 TaxID=1660089 RepID=UPI00086D7267|nr:2OG-Fe(II) oxygenase [Arenimonas sp. SCN 70-307]ODS64286.1 MAG: 2OG-Fe(II) oxygenase [Arenimonas sp. SCN 70-307]